MTTPPASRTLLSERERSKYAAFQREIDAFIDRYWHPADQRRWQQALQERGWTVSRWPKHLGGPGWDGTQCWLWDRALTGAGAEVGDRLTLDGIGPLLCHLAGPVAEAAPDRLVQALDAIRSFEAQWVWLDASSDPDLELTLDASAMSLDVEAVYVPNLPSADHALLCLDQPRLAEAPWLFWMPLRHDSISKLVLTELGGGEGTAGALRVAAYPLADGVVLARGAAAREALDAAVGLTSLHASAIGSGALTRLAEALAGGFELDDSLQSALTAVQIELLALEGVERRLANLSPRDEAYLPLELLRRHSGVALRHRIDDLVVQALGYYALPAEDQPVGANEPPIGPPSARLLVAAALRGRGLAIADEGEMHRLDRLAKVLGLPGDASTANLAGLD